MFKTMALAAALQLTAGAQTPWIRPAGNPIPLDNFGGMVNAVSYLADGKTLVADADKTLSFLDAVSGAKATGMKPVEGYRGIADRPLMASRTSTVYVAAWINSSGKGELSAVDWKTGNKRHLLDLAEEVESMALSCDEKLIALGFGDGTVRIVSADTGKAVLGPVKVYAGLKTPIGLVSDISVLAFSPDGKIIVVAGVDGTLYPVDAASGKAANRPLAQGKVGFEGPATSMAFTPSGKALIVASANALNLIDPATGAALGKPAPFERNAVALAISADGKHAATGHFDGAMQRWDLNLP
jgi:WD40 repeat protein